MDPKYDVQVCQLLSMPPFSLLGLHWFYLGNYSLGFLYLFTFGVLFTGCFDHDSMQDQTSRANLGLVTYPNALVTRVLGLLCLHNFAFGRFWMGVFYLCTFGNFGVGWVVDNCRLHALKQRYIDNDMPTYNSVLLDAYMCCLPLGGLLGAHHFYLGRYDWGLVYFCTFGCLGVGWIMDICKLSGLVHEYTLSPEFLDHYAQEQGFAQRRVVNVNHNGRTIEMQQV